MWRLFGGVFLGWTLGANDSANVFGTGVAAGVIRHRNAVVLIAVFVLLGAIVEGPKCMELMNDVANLGEGVSAAFLTTLAAGLTMLALTIASIPSSTSQAIMGAIIGGSLMAGGGLPQLSLLLKIVACWTLTPVGAAVIAYVLYLVAQRIQERYLQNAGRFEQIIGAGLIISGCYGAYSLGANNVANTTGVYYATGALSASAASLIGGLSIGFGALTFSRRVMLTVGNRITSIGPMAALVATIAQAITIHIYTQVGVPVSTSQAVVGAVVGIGLVRSIRAVSGRMLATIVTGWFATPVAAAAIASLFFAWLL